MNRSDLVDYVYNDDTKHPALVLAVNKDGTVDIFDFDSVTVLHNVRDNAVQKPRRNEDGKFIPHKFCVLDFVDNTKPKFDTPPDNPLNTQQLFLSLEQENALASAGISLTPEQLAGSQSLTSEQIRVLQSV